MPGGIEEQPDERPDGMVLPVTRQAELRTPGAIACVLESRYVLTGTAQGGQRPWERRMGRRCITRPQEGQSTTGLVNVTIDRTRRVRPTDQ